MGRILAVSDLHGNYPLWEKVKEQLQPDDELYFLGDAADRGLRGWDIIKEALANERVTYIRGNHDQFILDSWKDDWFDTALWFYNGGRQTYMAIMNDSVLEVEETLKKLQETPYARTLYIGNNIIGLNHAGCSVGYGKDYALEDLIWDRGHIADDIQFPDNIYIVHGHTRAKYLYSYGACDVQLNSSKTVGRYCGGHKICIDGGSAYSNKCALLDLDTLEEMIIEA